MRNSVELTKANPPKYWYTSLIIGVILFYVVQTIAGIPLFLAMKYLMPGEPGATYATLFSFAITTIVTIFFVKYMYKRPAESLGFHREGLIKNYVGGLLIGAGLLTFTLIASKVMGIITIEFNSAVNWTVVFIMFIGFVIQGMTEEVICRGYVQNTLRIRWGLVVTMIIQSAFFAGLHSLNNGMKLMPVINLFLFAAFIGILFYYNDNLWMASGIHTIWNFMQGPIMGIEVSGQVFPSTVFKSTFTGSDFLSGGSFGMEGSIFTTIAMVVGIIIVYLIYNKKNEVENA